MLYVSLKRTQMESGGSTDSTVPASFGLPVNATLPPKWFPSLQGDHLRRWSLARHAYSVQLKSRWVYLSIYFYSFYMFDTAGRKKQLKSRFGTWHSHSGNWFLRAFWSSQSLKKIASINFQWPQSSRNNQWPDTNSQGQVAQTGLSNNPADPLSRRQMECTAFPNSPPRFKSLFHVVEYTSTASRVYIYNTYIHLFNSIIVYIHMCCSRIMGFCS